MSRRTASHGGARLLRIAAALALLATLGAHGRASPQPGSPGEDTESRVGLADLPAYHDALSGRRNGEKGEPAPASFRDLWDHPEAWRGRRVEVAGRVARIFRQDAMGSFPALAEMWLSSPSGDLICAHSPIPPAAAGHAASIPEIGTSVHFTGVFMKTIRYAAGDQARLAPLVVGDRPPTADRPAQGSAPPASSSPEPWPLPVSPTAWAAGAALGVAIAAALAWRHLKGPAPQARYSSRREPGVALAPPEFLDREPRDESSSPGR